MNFTFPTTAPSQLCRLRSLLPLGTPVIPIAHSDSIMFLSVIGKVLIKSLKTQSYSFQNFNFMFNRRSSFYPIL